jgi:hypothetical protein
MTDDEVRTMTGRTWQEWGHLIDSWDGKTQGYAAIAHYLIEHQGVRRLWAQMIAVYYKQEWCSRRRD